MAIQDPRGFLFLLFHLQQEFSSSFCNWWPMLAAIVYVLVPMPYMFFASSADLSMDSTSIASGWNDAGKFLTGFSAIASFAIPAILAHKQMITVGALIMEIAAAVVLGATVAAYDYFATKDADYY